MQTIIEDNGYRAKMLCDSISPDGIRLTTMEVTFPRIVLAEFNTHRMFSRNSASSRAIPVEKQLKKLENPFVPIYWGKNQKGMQADQELESGDKQAAEARWRQACLAAMSAAQDLLKLGIHKQITNRLLEPFMWHTVICTATEWNNFFALRRHKDAQPEIKKIADLMWELLYDNSPNAINYSDWHLPLIDPNEVFDLEVNGLDVKMVSIGRCARVSYLTHDGIRDPKADIKLCEDLKRNGHMSPLEHVARPMTQEEIKFWSKYDYSQDRLLHEPFCGNFKGWIQFRKEIPHEADFSQKE